ncbi:epidermal growth factor receptor kinase substrate 8-like protein 1a [Cyclopterus lumpus]|uniref:EPS8 signaling adaptor L1a n=1 Tax=Cyclopterus lumpus TaxID=8103 RepID=A0A8C2XAB1_CYCLU|nr:epidermal growth factor receptor kinase substrate 8-like protein 1a [Cyclopterus lumpus]XP_034395920.1 epidermal growth factor receptor kinase substrate 8-like protein 1a [Cyclopterus lumpus]XP_034395921.1 epidermal growth factor receptor kinase substrate 8-like protein 1a [Cyclopterus lumpus]XP_034395922.1 epidermal growth factor receptor kinase substrate 8-like protein 1a [Cyclopterus lumpus]XP_034395923.1 epidermal growth factor receptor kinase substrate 8-like protein 1a [Cyclopterus lum
MSATPPAVAPRMYSGVRVMLIPGQQPRPGGLPIYTHVHKEKSAIKESNYPSLLNAERELEFMNHCFDDVERFMARLQQTVEAQSVLSQRGGKRSRKSKKKKDQEDDLLALKACPPSAEEFVDLFQKIKYSLSLLDRLKSTIAQPDAPELLHHIFVPLRLMMQTTGGPALGASVVSPAMTSGAVLLLQEHLIAEEKKLWTSLGANWTSPCLHLNVSVPPYSPVFLDGWKPQAYDSTGQLFEDPIESQHKQDALRESRSLQDQVQQTAELPGEGNEEVDGNGLPPEGERLYCCSYDFVARNSSELSVLQGETLEVINMSKKWWKCQNRFDQIGFVPSNILEPLSALNNPGRDSPAVHRESKKMPISPGTKFFSYAPSSPVGTSPTSPMRPQSMVLPSIQGEDNDRVLMVNDELLQRLAEKRGSVRPLVVPRTADTTPLNYHSPSAEVEAWLTTKGFSQQTVQGLGILNGAQLFSLKKEELRAVSPEEGARVYSQIMVQKALLEDVHKSTELETVMEKQKLKIGLKSEDDSM